MKPNDELFPDEVINMAPEEFEKRFGFLPADALEQKFFAVTGKRPDEMQRAFLESEGPELNVARGYKDVTRHINESRNEAAHTEPPQPFPFTFNRKP